MKYLSDVRNTFYAPHLISHESSKKQLFSYFLLIQLTIITVNIVLFLICKYFDLVTDLGISNIPSLTLKAAILAPIIEELMFRGVLKKSILNYSLFFLANLYFFRNLLNNNILLIILLASIWFLLLFFLKKKKYFNNDYNKYELKFLVYMSSFIFGFAHIAPSEFLSAIFIYSLIMTIPKIIGGFLLSMFRIKFGLLYSILFHCFNNSLGILILILSRS